MKFLLFCAFMLLTACASAPANIGFGQYQQFFTPSGTLFREATHSSTDECEANVRDGWRGFSSSGVTSSCAAYSRAKELPVVSKLSSQKYASIDFSFDSMQQCVAWQKQVRESGVLKGVNGVVMIDACSMRHYPLQ